MPRSAITAAALGAVWLCACGADDAPPPIAPPGAGPGGQGGASGPGGAGGNAGGAGGAGGEGGSSGGGGGVYDFPQCGYFDWEPTSDPPLVAGSAHAFLGGLSFDTLSIAWMTPDGDVHYADRSNPGEPFGGGDVLPAAAGYYRVGKVALSPDALRLIVVRADGKRFAELRRASPTDAFSGAPDESPFAAINASVGASETLGDPVLLIDDTKLYYSRFSASSTTTIYFATHTAADAPWVLGGALAQAELEQTGGMRRIPTGIASDDRTLFYWNEPTSVLRMAIRDEVDGPFVVFGDAGPYEFAVPSYSCGRLFYSDQSDPQVITYADQP